MRPLRLAAAIFTLATTAACSTLPAPKPAEPVRFAGDCGVFDPNTRQAVLAQECLRLRESTTKHELTCREETERLKQMTSVVDAMHSDAKARGNPRMMDLAAVLLVKKADQVQGQCGLSSADSETLFGRSLTAEQIGNAAAAARAALNGDCRKDARILTCQLR